MLFDPFTAGAQVINFIILVALLKRFLYDPLLRAMDRREARIRTSLEAAEAEFVRARQEAGELARKNRTLEEERSARLDAIAAEVQERRAELLGHAKTDAEEARKAWQRMVQHERHDFLENLKKRAGKEILDLARKALSDLADEELNQKTVDAFLRKIETLPPEKRAICAKAAGEGGLAVHTPFDPGPARRESIAAHLRAVCGRDVDVKFHTDPQMPFGIRMTAGTLRLSWDIESYMDSFEKTFSDVLAMGAVGTPATIPEGAAAELTVEDKPVDDGRS